MALDFGYGQNVNSDSTIIDNSNDNKGDVTNIDNGKIQHDANGEPVTDITDVDNNDNKNNNNNTTNKDNDNTNDKDVNLEPGTSIEIDNETYTVDDNGNVIDKDGNIFKESKDVQEWIKTFDKVDEKEKDSEGITINTIQDALGIEITGEDDKPVEFENSVDGIKAYVNAVIDAAKDEHYEVAINTLYQKYPILNDVLNYYIANGNSLEGFGEVPDRSNITIDDSNEQQHEAIIRAAWEERGQKGDISGYIQYLKSSGTLLATAKQELEALQEADKEYKEQVAKEAELKENQRIQQLQEYWDGVHDVIKNRKIAGYEIPESIIINRNGQKLSVSPENFFDYIYRVDKDGLSAYQKDLAAETFESRRDDELLRAYLKFVGGNYSNLVNMAINKEKVNKLKLVAKERNRNTIRINRPNTSNTNNGNVDLGYN